MADPGYSPPFTPQSNTLFGRAQLQRDHEDHEHRVDEIYETPSPYLDNEESDMSRHYAEYRKRVPFWKPDSYHQNLMDKKESTHNSLIKKSCKRIETNLPHTIMQARERMRSKGFGPSLAQVLFLTPPTFYLSSLSSKTHLFF